MSLPAGCDLQENRQKKSDGKRNKENRNSKRRRPKNAANMQDNECDEKIWEILNSLSNALANSSLEKVCQGEGLTMAGGSSAMYTESVKADCQKKINKAENNGNRPSTSNKCSVPSIQSVRVEELERCGKDKYKSSSDLCRDTNLKLFIEKRKKNNLNHLEQNVLKEAKSIDPQGHCTEESQVFSGIVINKSSPSTEFSVSDINPNQLLNRKHDRITTEKCNEKSTPNKLKKSVRSRKSKIEVKEPELSDGESDEFDGQNIVIINSNLNHKDQRLRKRDGGGNSEKNQPSTSASPKSEREWPKDTKFPVYLNKGEIECALKFGILHSGVIRINQKNFKEAYITAPDKGMDILIMGLIDRNRALEGDEVHYVLKEEEHFRTSEDGQIQKTAAVVAIKTPMHCRGAVGTVKCKGDSALFSPRDSRIPRMTLKKKNWPSWFSKDLVSNTKKLFYAKIKDWHDMRYAEGTLVMEVGDIGEIEAESSAILLMFDLDGSPYPDSLRTYLPTLPYVISAEDISQRADFREECIFTIDPASAKDLDDAVSCKRLPNGNYEIGVHISDVTHFLHKGSPLDAAVAKKATSIYMVQKVYHMLPRELCDLCSLFPGEDKLTFSVIWEMTPQFQVVMHNFKRSVINSCGKFSYDQIQQILDGEKNPQLPELHGGHTVQEVVDSVKMLNSIAVHLRKKRFDNGALRIDQTKISFSLDEFGFPLNYQVYVNKEAHRLIEEFMLLANITVAEWISLYFPKVAFLRCHSPPQSYMMQKLQKNLVKYGIDLDISSAKSLHQSLMKYSGSDSQSTARLMVLNMLLAKPMARANYYCSGSRPSNDRSHYALNVPLYTHFTSPIRRYADVMVHRLLAASLGYCKMPDWTTEYVQRIAENCNKMKYAAKLAGEKSTEFFLNIYTLRQGPLICQGAVCDIKQKSFDCVLLENGSCQRVYVENSNVSFAVQNEKGILRMTIIWPGNEGQEKDVQVIELFSIVKIKLKKCDEENKMKAFLLRSNEENEEEYKK